MDDGPMEASASACPHSSVRAGANGTHAWRKCVLCGKIIWRMNKATKEVESHESFTGAIEIQEEPVENSLGPLYDDKYKSEKSDIYIARAGKDIVGFMVPDTGCKKSVAGVRWHRAMRGKLRREYGLKPLPLAVDAGFRFGDGRED
eukprot:4835459-Amphidinium_carterae.2